MHMKTRLQLHVSLSLFFLTLGLITSVPAQRRQLQTSIPSATLLPIIRAEDERRWDGDLRYLLTRANPTVRGRAALAAGRIGNEGALAELVNILQRDKDSDVRALAAFAIGEIE